MKMKSLLLVAHGSRREESNIEIADIANRLRIRSDDHFQVIAHAFLELAEPSIPDAIDTLVAQGSVEILVLPYFLSAGRHVHKDIPEIIRAKRVEHTQVDIVMAPYLGEADAITDVLISLSRSSHG